MGRIVKINIELKIFFLMLILIFSIGIVYNFHRNCSIFRDSNYTVAVTEKKSNGRVANQIYINFTYNKIRYDKLTSFYGSKPIIGQKYFIIVNKNNIEQSVLLSNCPVPDSLKISPNGWDKMPIPAYQKEVDAYFEQTLNSGLYKLFPKCE
jgi:hypothetical protein